MTVLAMATAGVKTQVDITNNGSGAGFRDDKDEQPNTITLALIRQNPLFPFLH
jgi:hypothetical protein